MAANESVGMDLASGSIVKKLLVFVLPLLLANIVQQLYNTVDMAVIGHFVGNEGTVGVSTGGEVCTLLTFIAVSFGAACQIYVAQLCGAGDRTSINETIGTALTSLLLLSIVFTVVCEIFCSVFLDWLNCPDGARRQAERYMEITCLGLPFIFGYNAICGILRGVGESKRPLLFVTIAAVSNVALDLLLVVVFGLEAAGTAIATVAAQLLSFLAALLFLYKRKETFGLTFSRNFFCIRKKHLAVLLKLGVPLAAQSVFIQASQMICAAEVNTMGLVESAAFSIGNKVQKLINVFSMSITHGSGAMIGQNMGARNYERVRRITYTTIGVTYVCAAFACAASLLFPEALFGVFSKNPEVVALGVTYLRIATIIFLLAPLQGGYGAVITGSGATTLNFFVGVLDGVILRLSLSFLLAYPLGLGIEGFFYGNALARLGPVLVGGVYFYSGRWKRRRLLAEAPLPVAESQQNISCKI